MDKMFGTSMEIERSNIEKLKELFPNVVSEGKVDYDMLRTVLGDSVDNSKEKYQFTWNGKANSIKLAQSPSTATLRPCKSESKNWDSTENLYIEGDNLEVLKQLQKTYYGRIKLIYIDPPYNTGNDFVYNDSYSDSIEEYKKQTKQAQKSNPETSGSYHSKWLNLIYPRLILARNLLTKDGVIFISIDDKEQDNLKRLCNDVFGENNFVAQLIWAAGRKNDSKHISISHEYILCYFKNAQYISDNKIVWRERKQGLDDIYTKYESLKKQYGSDCETIEKELKAWYKGLPDGHPAKDHDHYSRVDEQGIFFADNISWPGGGGPQYEVIHPITHKPVRVPSRGWLTNEKTMKEWIEQGRVEFGKDETSVPTLKSYLKDREFSVPYSVFYKDGRAASKRLATLMGNKVFENPKDETIIQRIIEFSGTQDGDIILDFFSGSGTTAHSMFLADLNQEMHRKFILVQLPEIIDPENAKSEKGKKVAKDAIALLDDIGSPHNICEIGKERIRRAGNKIAEENPLLANKIDTGFKVFKLDSTNINPWDNLDEYDENTIYNSATVFKIDRTKEDVLYEIMLKYGVFDMPVTDVKINGKSLYRIGQKHMIVCLEDDVNSDDISEICKLNPRVVVFKEDGFKDDNAKINAEYNLKNSGVEDVKCI